jgi:hypothetical protein
MVRKLSKDRSKFRGSTARSRVRMQAPLFVMSITPHERTPVCPLKNRNAPLQFSFCQWTFAHPLESAPYSMNSL